MQRDELRPKKNRNLGRYDVAALVVFLAGISVYVFLMSGPLRSTAVVIPQIPREASLNPMSRRQLIFDLLVAVSASKDHVYKERIADYIRDKPDLRSSIDDDVIVDQLELLMFEENLDARSIAVRLAATIGEPARRTLPTAVKALAMGEKDRPQRIRPVLGGPDAPVPLYAGYYYYGMWELLGADGLRLDGRLHLCRKLSEIGEPGVPERCSIPGLISSLDLQKSPVAISRDGVGLLLDQIDETADSRSKIISARHLRDAAEHIVWGRADLALIKRIEALTFDQIAQVRAYGALALMAVGAPARYTSASLRQALAQGDRGAYTKEYAPMPPAPMTRTLIAAAIWSLEGGDELAGVEREEKCAEFPSEIRPLACFPELAELLP
ncbi:hypothetical protein ACFSM5_22060 [Lacibacterium aquatile]|uniref:HEAT repeat domain-containing protein n=1 Tax=Lacibacterium aquatile TaxID=1168082 RepID=A0ABW5E320_9PROT